MRFRISYKNNQKKRPNHKKLLSRTRLTSIRQVKSKKLKKVKILPVPVLYKCHSQDDGTMEIL